MPDGTIFKLERDVPRIRSDAVPTIFPNLPKYLTKVVIKRKPPKVRQEKVRVAFPREESPETHADVGGSCDPGLEEAGTVEGVDNILMLAEVASRRLAEESACSSFSVNSLLDDLHSVPLPGCYWGTAVVDGNVVFMSVGHSFMTEKTIVVMSDLKIKIMLFRKEVSVGIDLVSNLEELVQVLQVVDKLKVCAGVSIFGSGETTCLGYLPEISAEGSGRRCARSRCSECEAVEKRMKDRLRKKKAPSKPKHVVALKICRMKNKRLLGQIQNVKAKVLELQKKCADISKEDLEDKLKGLPALQQDAVRVCFSASKVKSSKGRRYPLNFMYECLLLRIKSRKTYEHIRAHNILPLPSVSNLSRYIRQIKGAYGFQQATFDCLKEKSENLAPEDRRGTLLLDEMKLSMSVTFDKNTLKVNGFTDLGDHTPLHQKNQRGDHALVMMFQPFRGRWVQALACFLSKGCASGTILHHLVIECIILLEQANFHVDVVTCDGAQWNRSMWRMFGIDGENVSCGHPFNPTRRLWFTSDFPHLMKNMRNFLTTYSETWTPDGIVKLEHWDAVVSMDSKTIYHLKACPNLTKDHIHPKPYQKMNVTRAFQFFGRNVAAAMLSYKSHHAALDDCDPSIAVIERMKGLITAMNSRTPKDALRRGSEQWRAITEFHDYLQLWESGAKRNGYNFLSSNTALGFKVSLTATLQLFNFLETECGFNYLMTARLNQDALERFFGMMRSACGSNDHPDSKMFIYIFRLMSTYSLVKPPAGSSMSGAEVLSTLMSAHDVRMPEDPCERFRSILDSIVEKGVPPERLVQPIQESLSDHTYSRVTTPVFVLSYFSGYVARKVMKSTQCESCWKSLISSNPGVEEHERFTAWQSEGHLTFPSERLLSLITMLEEVALSVLTTEELGVDIVFRIATAIEEVTLPLVGCEAHCHSLTEYVVRFCVNSGAFCL